MRVKVLSRNPDDYVRETKLDLQRGERGARGGARGGPGRTGCRPPGRAGGGGGGSGGGGRAGREEGGRAVSQSGVRQPCPLLGLPPGAGASQLRAA